MTIKGAILEIKPVKQVTERFSVQNVYLDTSRTNSMTGEVYQNINLVEVANQKVDFNRYEPGDIVEVECYVNGRVVEKRDGGQFFIQRLNASKVQPVRNTNDEQIKIPVDQLVSVNLPD